LQKLIKMKRVCCLIILITLSQIVFAQIGKITGKVISSASGQPLAGATLLLIEKKRTKAADQNGVFVFSKLEAGTYSIKCSYSGSQEKILEEIIVKESENTDINISLDIKSSDVVIVTAPKRIKAAGATIESLLIAQKNSTSVSDGVTAESLKKLPVRTASDAIKLVSGASIQDDKFAVIRGLNDRYNAAFINGAPLPSTESDRKAFSFDIFPSAILDNLIIYKTATPDKTGDFVGGIIDISTKSTTSQNFNTISFGTSYNSLATGKTHYFSDNKSKTDFLGLDDGLRGVPDGLPETISGTGGSTSTEKAEYAKLFKDYKWGVRQAIAKPNYNFQFSKGINIQRKDKEFLGAIFSVNYSKNNTFSPGNRDRFRPTDTVQFVQLNDSVYNEETIVSALANFSVKINNSNTISWKNNYSINTDDRLIKRRNTPDLIGDPTSALRDVVRSYTSNQILSSQLIGEHLIGNKKTKINWLGSYTKVERDPSLRRTSYAYNPTIPDAGIGSAFILNALNQNSGSGTMFLLKSNESIKSIKLEITQPYTLLKSPQSLKIGAGYLFRERAFSSRLLGYTPYNDVGVLHDNSLAELPEDQIFLPQHIGLKKSGQGGFMLNEANPTNNNYDASSATAHAFIMNDQRFLKNFRLIYGVRMEQFTQKLNSPYATFSTTQPPITIDSTITDFLPSINLVYALTKKMNIRLSYAETVNRPEFRELARVVFYDYLQQYSISGFEKNKRAKIKNYDFRYEFFPGKAQLFSVSVFYKEFKNPIETLFDPGLLGSQAFYANTTSATLKGVEAEFRSLLSTLVGIKREKSILNKFTLSANVAFTESNVEILDTIFSYSPSDFRNNNVLQGQSPYIFNGSLSFNDDKTGFSSTLSVNRIGDRMIVKGIPISLANIPNLLEKGRTVIDFQVAKLFLKNKLELKVNIRDLLAQDIIQYEDFNEESKSYTAGKDAIFSVYKAPTTISVGVTYKF
jgi:TonB dependent receptor/Carboxypeptidase regulatory-like domain/TonB-dependent Receptor Plug Domain